MKNFWDGFEKQAKEKRKDCPLGLVRSGAPPYECVRSLYRTGGLGLIGRRRHKKKPDGMGHTEPKPPPSPKAMPTAEGGTV